jgi:hypothetical protein
VVTDDLDHDQPPPWFDSFYGWRRTRAAPTTVSEAEQMAFDAWKFAYESGVGAEHRAHEVGDCKHISNLRRRL